MAAAVSPRVACRTPSIRVRVAQGARAASPRIGLHRPALAALHLAHGAPSSVECERAARAYPRAAAATDRCAAIAVAVRSAASPRTGRRLSARPLHGARNGRGGGGGCCCGGSGSGTVPSASGHAAVSFLFLVARAEREIDVHGGGAAGGRGRRGAGGAVGVRGVPSRDTALATAAAPSAVSAALLRILRWRVALAVS